MLTICTLLVFSSLAYTQALQCGIRSIVDNDLKKAVTTCLSKNMTMTDVYESTHISPEEQGTKSSNSTNEIKANMNDSMPLKNIKNRKARSTPAMKFNRQTVTETTTLTPTSQTEIVTEVTTTEPSPQDGKCIIQCILSKMDLVNEEGFPDQQRILDTLVKNAKGRELEDFMRDTTEECFQRMRADSSKTSCDFSIELIKCLADEGKSNCGDWPAGDISLFN